MSASFSITQKLDEGGNGLVYLATDPSGSAIAIKTFKSSENKAAAKQEFLVGNSLHHPNLGRCLGLIETPVVLT